MEKTLKSLVIPYGVFMGVLLALLTVTAYVVDLEIMTKWWINLLNLAIVLVIAIMAVKKAKNWQKSLFSFKDAFSAYFIPVAVGTLISTLISLLLFNVVDPEAAQQLTEIAMETTRNMLEKFGAPESDIENAMSEMRTNNPYSVGNFFTGFVFWLAFYALIGLIVALVFREKDPTKI